MLAASPKSKTVAISDNQNKLLVTATEAARMLSISERLLWSFTKQKKIKAVRLGRAVRYAVSALEEFVSQQQSA